MVGGWTLHNPAALGPTLLNHPSELAIPTSPDRYFSPTCGARLAAPSELDATFRDFWRHLAEFAPGDFVAEHLSTARPAEICIGL